MNDLLLLDDHFPGWTYSDKEGYISINGCDYLFEISNDINTPDDIAARVQINGTFYYFGG